MENINLDFRIQGRVYATKKVDSPLMVCSHERSGTHFMMNSISKCTHYVSDPILNYDYYPIGGLVNFFRVEQVSKFFENLQSIDSSSGKICLCSIIKSHFPLQLLGEKPPGKMNIIYIYRNPVDVFVSYWKFLKIQGYFEGPKTISPLELAKHIPCGRSQRYQIRNCKSYFDRWAEHVSGACNYAKANPNVILVKYMDLLNSHSNIINAVCTNLGIKKTRNPSMPENNDLKIEGSRELVSFEERDKLTEYCHNEISRYTSLPYTIMDS